MRYVGTRVNDDAMDGNTADDGMRRRRYGDDECPNTTMSWCFRRR
jgi:hypothetical protein